MNTISSSSSYTATSAASKGLSSLASGIDTESMVESMLSGIQSKIDKAQGDKTVLGWKQDMYRDIIKDMNEFHDKYFNILSENCLLSNAFYNAMKAVSSSGAVNVTADSTASTGKTSIEVGQLATATSIKSSSAVSGVLSGRIDADALKKREVIIEVGGDKKTIDLSGIDSQPDKKQAILAAFNSAGAGNIASYDAEGKLVLDSGDEEKAIKVSGDSSAWGLATTGLAAYSSSYKGKLTTAEEVDPDKKPSFTVSLDGVKKTITIDPNKINLTDPTNPNYSALETDINAQLKAAFGNGVKKFEIKNGLMTFEAGAGREIVLGGDSDVLKNIGFVAGQSNRIARGQTLKEAAFGTPLEGNYFAININGVDLEFSGDETISQMMSKINNSDAGVRISYNNFEDQFVMESTSTGAGYDITMSQTSGNLLNALFGKNNFDTGNSVGSGLAGNVSLKGGDVSSELFADGSEKEIDLSSTNGEFRLNVNGKDYVFTIKKDSEDENDDGKYTPKELVKKINEQLEKQFGVGEIKLEWDDAAHDATIKVASNQAVKFGGITAKSSSAKDLADMLGFKKGANNYIDDTSDLTQVDLKNLGFTSVPADISNLDELINKVNNDPDAGGTLSIKDGRLHLTAKNSGTDVYAGLTGSVKFMLASVFGSNGVNNDGGSFTPSLTLGTSATGTATKTEGQNAIVKINGVETERSTNIFKTNGIQFELTDTTATKDATGNIVWDSSKAAKVDTSRDTDKMFDTIKSLVADYNKIVEKLNGKVKEDADYKDYPPLTDAQKKEMSESEVKLWNEKAQKGLLRNDSDVSTLLSSMRMAFYNKPAGSSISIWDLGIETTDDYKSGGKLSLNESTLKQMLQSNPDDIRELFFNGTDGIFDQLSTSIKASTNTSFGSRGTLVALAGYGGTASDKSNTIYNRMRDLDEKVKTLKKTYEKQKTRYWNQFNSMEKLIANMNSQSSWLAQQFA